MLEDSNIPEISKAVRVIRDMSADTRMREAARQREKELHDHASWMEDGIMMGREQGLAEGMAKGRAEGIAPFSKRVEVATKHPPAGIASPMKYPWTTSALTLNLASLSIPHTAKEIATTHPNHEKACRQKLYARNPGATPKETRSQRESISLPISLLTPKKRAERPSSPSATKASRMKIDPQKRSPLCVERIEQKPNTRFDDVSILGIKALYIS